MSLKHDCLTTSFNTHPLSNLNFTSPNHCQNVPTTTVFSTTIFKFENSKTSNFQPLSHKILTCKTLHRVSNCKRNHAEIESSHFCNTIFFRMFIFPIRSPKNQRTFIKHIYNIVCHNCCENQIPRMQSNKAILH